MASSPKKLCVFSSPITLCCFTTAMVPLNTMNMSLPASPSTVICRLGTSGLRLSGSNASNATILSLLQISILLKA